VGQIKKGVRVRKRGGPVGGRVMTVIDVGEDGLVHCVWEGDDQRESFDTQLFNMAELEICGEDE
jgi:uncharacterized protein YodC (DUF2158 family)